MDQFEEIFTVGKYHKEREKWIDELYWLIENHIPTSLTRSGQGKISFSFHWFNYPVARVIISLREDYLPHMIDLIKKIPSIDRVKFRVNHFNGKQAREIIGMPGGFHDERIINGILRCFYPAGTAEGAVIPDEKLEIEPALLSVLCYQFYRRRDLVSKAKNDQYKVIGDFYDSVMEKFSDKVKIFIKSRLLTEGGFRIPFYLDPGHRMRNDIAKLVDIGILRKFHNGEKEYIEIIHDVLVPFIKEKISEEKIHVVSSEATKGSLEGELRNRFQSVFISYGGPDEVFAERLNDSLVECGIKTFLFSKDARFGDKLHRVMREGVNKYDRVVLICSRNSLDRPGVVNELEETLQREARQMGANVLIPITLDDYVFGGWAPQYPDLAQTVRDRVVADFRGTLENEILFKEQVDRLISALKR